MNPEIENQKKEESYLQKLREVEEKRNVSLQFNGFNEELEGQRTFLTYRLGLNGGIHSQQGLGVLPAGGVQVSRMYVSGALNKPVWIFLGFQPDRYFELNMDWFLNRRDEKKGMFLTIPFLGHFQYRPALNQLRGGTFSTNLSSQGDLLGFGYEGSEPFRAKPNSIHKYRIQAAYVLMNEMLPAHSITREGITKSNRRVVNAYDVAGLQMRGRYQLSLLNRLLLEAAGTGAVMQFSGKDSGFDKEYRFFDYTGKLCAKYQVNSKGKLLLSAEYSLFTRLTNLTDRNEFQAFQFHHLGLVLQTR